jgi:hypothetical protein
MAFNRTQARALCSDTEYRLFEASTNDHVREHTPAQLRSKIARARRLRDKYRDLFKRQRLATRARTGTKKGDAPARNARTEQKARLFEEVLTRFEGRSETLARQAQRESERAERAADRTQPATRRKRTVALPQAKRKSRTKTKPKRKAKKRAAGFSSEDAASANRRSRNQKMRVGAVRGHARASGRRSQARRDSRR